MHDYNKSCCDVEFEAEISVYFRPNSRNDCVRIQVVPQWSHFLEEIMFETENIDSLLVSGL